MPNNQKVTVIIPAFNEEKGLDIVLSRIKQDSLNDMYEILVVDDGSTDETASVALKHGFRVIKHPYNKGYGSALKTGLRAAKGENIVLLDGDNQHNPSLIPELLKDMIEYDLIIASRGSDKQAGAFFRNIGNFVLKKIAGYLVGMKLPELTSGFRAFKKEKALEFMHLYPNGYSFSTTNTLAFITSGYNVKFISIKMEKRTKDTKSQLKPLKEGVNFLILILRMVILFNPLKVFLPVSFFFILLGSIYGITYVFLITHIPAGASMSILVGFVIFFFGIIADQIAILRRSIK